MFGEINEIWGVIGLDDTACASFGPVASGALLSVSRDNLQHERLKNNWFVYVHLPVLAFPPTAVRLLVL
jgi:hypothetical protein